MANPNDIPPSPSLSALERLSLKSHFTDSVISRSESASTLRPPSGRSRALQMPEIPEIEPPTSMIRSASSASSRSGSIVTNPYDQQTPVARSARSAVPDAASQLTESVTSDTASQITDGTFSTPKKSKLASLASSRAGRHAKTHSELSTTFDDTGSIVTYPELRPSNASFISNATSIPPATMQQHVERDIVQTSKGIDQPLQRAVSKMTRATREDSPQSPSPTRSVVPTTPKQDPPKTVDPIATSPDRPASKLALLAQRKSNTTTIDVPPKVSRPKVMGPPFAHTEYFSPTTLSPSATTAITTYIQTPDNMLALSRCDLPPSFPTFGSTLQRGDGKSKLALKAKKTHNKSSTVGDDALSQTMSPVTVQNSLYSPRRRNSEVTPSAFATLLVDGTVPFNDGSVSPSVQERGERQQRKQRMKALIPAHIQSPTSKFAFDVPSPDDVVMNARRGTALSPQEGLRSPRKQTSVGTRSHASVASAK